MASGCYEYRSISKALYQAFVAVDEKGTDAAAATAFDFSFLGLLPQRQLLIVDRPFIFVIRDTRTGQILFIGRVSNPIY